MSGLLSLVRYALATLAVVACAMGWRVVFGEIGPGWLPWPEGIVDERPLRGPYQTVSVPEEPWAMLIGGSSFYYAIDPRTVGVPIRKQTRSRGYATETAYALNWALRYTLDEDSRPSRILWGVNRASFVDRRDVSVHPCIGYARTSRYDEAFDARVQPCEGADRWLKPEEEELAAAVLEDPWDARKAPVQDMVHHGFRFLFGRSVPVPRPESYSKYKGSSPKRRRHRLQKWKPLGVFDRPMWGGHIRAVEAVYELAQEYGIPLHFVVLPEHSTSRKLYAPGTRESFTALLQANSDGVIDLYSTFDDDKAFWDQAHVNGRGRRKITQILARWLKKNGVPPRGR